MRVILVPELYCPDAATANGTLNDLVTLAEKWLERDPSLSRLLAPAAAILLLA